MWWRLLVTLSALIIPGCINDPAAPPCNATPFDQASTSGDTITTTTGLRYIEGAPGAAGAVASWCHSVAVHYTGYLLDGTKFDSSHDIDRPLVFTPGLGAAIDGFEQGIIGMRIGGTRRLIIPPELGYGSEPVRDNSGTIIVPANSTLVFDLEVLLVGS